MNIFAAPWSDSLLFLHVNVLKAGLFLYGFLLALLLASCTSLSPDGNLYPENYSQVLVGLQDWSLRGRLNIRSGDGNETININWQQNHEEYDINLSGALGMGAVQITGNNDGVTINRAGEEDAIVSSDLDSLSTEVLGYAFPLRELLYWIKGIAAPGSQAARTRNPQGLTATLSQADARGQRWELQYDRYQTVDSYALPGRIRLEQVPYRLTFVISDWDIP